MTKKINHCFCFNDTKDNFIKWMIGLLGPVILGAKPAEILSFPEKDEAGISKMNEIRCIFSKYNKISYREFSYCNKCTKILFYNPMVLNEHLNEHKNLKFLKSIEYPKEYNLDKYLDHIIEKMKKGTIPDEIGIFLGYPLKDVMGFIGHPSLKLTKVNGWRVYGDARLSDEKYKAFLNARNEMKILLENNKVEELLLA